MAHRPCRESLLTFHTGRTKSPQIFLLEEVIDNQRLFAQTILLQFPLQLFFLENKSGIVLLRKEKSHEGEERDQGHVQALLRGSQRKDSIRKVQEES